MATYYSGGAIAIPAVTGDIQITVTAVAQAVSYTNQITQSLAVDLSGDIYNDVGYLQDTRWGSSGGTTATGTTSTYRLFTTGLIPLQKGSVYRLKNCWMDADASTADYPAAASGVAQWMYSSAGVKQFSLGWVAFDTTVSSYGTYITDLQLDSEGHVVGFTWCYENDLDLAYICLTLAGLGEEAVLTIDEEIE